LQNQGYKYIGDIQIGDLTNIDIQNLINTLVAKKYSYSTIRKAYDAINSCFKLGIIKGDIIKNPCAGVSPPSKLIVNYSKEIKFFNDEEVEAICRESLL
jgi:site-specific recombinase XerD